MRPVLLSAISILVLSVALPASATPTKHKKPATTSTSHTTTHTRVRHTASRTNAHTSKAHPKYAPSHAPMDTERATAIQTALIRQGYLSGEPTGTWDAQSMAAMQKLQSDNGWQTKIVPDSRAIIKLGLGPQGPTPAPN